MKTIAIFVNSLERGGAERVSIYLSEYFKDMHYKCYIITNRTGKNEYIVPKGVERIALSNKKRLSNIFRLRNVLKRLKVDSLLIMGTSECIITMPGTIGLNIRTIVSERNDPGHYNGNKIVIKISQYFMRFADNYVFQTKEAKNYYNKILAGRGVVISNPLKIDELPEIWKKEKKKYIFTMGRLVPQKNQKLLINAFSKLKDEYSDYVLKIYGEGPLKDSLKKQIYDLKMTDRIFLEGNQANILSLVKDAYAFIMTSDFEGMPNALIEAMAMGITCISTDCPCGGPGSLITHKKNGILFSCNDEEELIYYMKYIFDNAEICEKMGKKASKIREKLSVQNIGKQWLDLIIDE